jgi:uncharacterized coiled-coil DUF342 family protein
LTEQQKTKEIDQTNQQIAALEEQANKAKAETRKFIEKRNELNEQFRKLNAEIGALKAERDSLNDKVQTLKLLRDETRKKTHSIAEEIKNRREKIAELKKKTPKRSHQALEKELADIEWKIQTTSLPLQEEKRLIENVKHLETELAAYRKIERQTNKIVELRKEVAALGEKADAFHQELSTTAQNSQEIHQKMIDKISESKKIKGEADSLHRAYLEAKEKAAPSNAELKRLIEQKKRLQDALRKEEEQQRKTKEQALKEKLEAQARDKLRRGEKISWEEFQLVAGDDSETQD